MLQVGEVQHPAAGFLGGIGLVKLRRHVQQGLEGAGGLLQVRQHRLGGREEELLPGFELRPAEAAHLTKALLHRRVLGLAHRAHPAKGFHAAGDHRVPALAGQKRLQLPQILGKARRETFFNLGILRHLLERRLEFLDLPGEEAAKLRKKVRAPGRFGSVSIAVQVQGFPGLLPPAGHIRAAAHLLLDLQNGAGQPPVIPAVAKDGGHGEKVAVLGGVELLQKALEHLLPQCLGFGLLGHPEIRGQIQQMGIGAQEIAAEGMHRGDLRQVDPVELVLEVTVVGRGGQAAAELLGDFQPQLRGGGLGVGDDQEFVDVVGLAALQNALQEPIHQHLGLPRAGGGGDQQRPALAVHHRLLGGGQANVSHGSPPLALKSPRTPWRRWRRRRDPPGGRGRRGTPS